MSEKTLWIGGIAILIYGAILGETRGSASIITLVLIAGGIYAAVKIVEQIKISKIKALDGRYEIPISLPEFGEDIVARITYTGLAHMWDINYVGPEKTDKDIWDKLDDEGKRTVNHSVQRFISNARGKAGV